MNNENLSVEQQLQFVDKIRDKVKGTDLEPIWEKLYTLLSKINSLSIADKNVIDATVKKLIEKVEHFKVISQQQLEKAKNDKNQQCAPNNIDHVQNISNSESNKFKRKSKKVKRWRRSNDFSHAAMSPRRDQIPILRIRLAEIYKTKWQKEEKKRNKKVKEALKKIADSIEENGEQPNESAIQEESNENEKNSKVNDKTHENNLQSIAENEMVITSNTNKDNDQNQGTLILAKTTVTTEMPALIEISTVAETSEVLNQSNRSEHNLSDCYVRIEKYVENPKKASNKAKHDQIPIEKSKSSNPSDTAVYQDIQTIIIDDSDNEMMDNVSCASDECTFNDSVYGVSSKESSPNDQQKSGNSSAKNKLMALSDTSINTPKKLNASPKKSVSPASKSINKSPKMNLENSSKFLSQTTPTKSGIQTRRSSVLNVTSVESTETQVKSDSLKSNSRNSQISSSSKSSEISFEYPVEKSGIHTKHSSALNISKVETLATQLEFDSPKSNKQSFGKSANLKSQVNSRPTKSGIQTRRSSVLNVTSAEFTETQPKSDSLKTNSRNSEISTNSKSSETSVDYAGKKSGINTRRSSNISEVESLTTQLKVDSPKCSKQSSEKSGSPKSQINATSIKSGIQTRRSSVLNVSRADFEVARSRNSPVSVQKNLPVLTQMSSTPQSKRQTRRASILNVSRIEPQPSSNLQSINSSKGTTKCSESSDSLLKTHLNSEKSDTNQSIEKSVIPKITNRTARKSASQMRRNTTSDVIVTKIVDLKQSPEKSVNETVTASFKRPLESPSNSNRSKKSTSTTKLTTAPSNNSSSPIPQGSRNTQNNEHIDAVENSLIASTSSIQTPGQQVLLDKIKDEVPKGYMTPPMTEIPTHIVLNNIPKDRRMILLDPKLTLRKIRPWLQNSEHRKYLKNCEEMLGNGYCLSAMFKCMGSTCSYYTNNPELFLKHLNLHHKYQTIDIKNYSQCSYCNFIDDESKKLVEHITNSHGNNKFQCAYCFYRSYDIHINTHYNLFHALKPETIIECKPLITLNEKLELSQVWKNLISVCRPIFCALCKSKFYNIKLFENHFKSYDYVPSSRCIKCKFEINKETVTDHLKNCHGFGDFNCAYCSYGSDSSNNIKVHISNNHTSKPLFYFDRSIELPKFPKMGSTNKEDVSKTIQLKQLIQPKTANMNNIKIFNNSKELENAANINIGILNT